MAIYNHTKLNRYNESQYAGTSSSRGIASAPRQDSRSCSLPHFAGSFGMVARLDEQLREDIEDMMPSLDDQERIFVNKYVYRLESIQRGDVVVFRYPRDPSKSFIKRVIALAGDRIRIESGEVFVNGEALEEDYVPAAYADQRSYGEIVIPPNSYFVLGDHRTMSNDSRDFGPVSIGYIYGKAVFGYWPMDKMGRVR